MADNKAYACSLDESSLQKARKELHEDPKEILGVLKTFRDWIQQQHWLKTPTGMKTYRHTHTNTYVKIYNNFFQTRPKLRCSSERSHISNHCLYM